MFDDYNIILGRSGPSHVTHNVHEHRAPTDESIKIYKEMREKIEKEILGKCRAVCPVLGEVEFVMMAPNMQLQKEEFLYIFNLNGKEYKRTVEIDMFDLRTKDMSEILEIFRKDVVECLSECIVFEMVKGPNIQNLDRIVNR